MNNINFLVRWAAGNEYNQYTDVGQAREIRGHVKEDNGNITERPITIFTQIDGNDPIIYASRLEWHETSRWPDWYCFCAQRVHRRKREDYDFEFDHKSPPILIKKFNLQELKKHLIQAPTIDNPFRDVFYMREFSDNNLARQAVVETNLSVHFVTTDKNGFVAETIDQNMFASAQFYMFVPFMGRLVDSPMLRTPDTTFDVLAQMDARIRKLHELSLFHRNITASCWFIAHDGRIVLGNFGSVGNFTADHPVNQQRVEEQPRLGHFEEFKYQAPERFFYGSFFPFEGDHWSKHICLWEFHTGLHLYYEPYPNDLMFRFVIMCGVLTPKPDTQRIEVLMNELGGEATELLITVCELYNKITDMRRNERELPLLVVIERALRLKREDRIDAAMI